MGSDELDVVRPGVRPNLDATTVIGSADERTTPLDPQDVGGLTVGCRRGGIVLVDHLLIPLVGAAGLLLPRNAALDDEVEHEERDDEKREDDSE